ncbi:MAG: CoB--CoM heterodisulfide reductase iron-sulfur subunit B family protein [Acidobacteriota bacterium]
MKDYIYYPGCSMQGNAKHYEESLLPVLKTLGMETEEMEDWNCCGATAYFSVDDKMAAAICGRNLSIAEKAGKDILAPCAGCFLTLKKSNHFLKEGSTQAKKILDDLKNSGCEYKGGVDVKHPLDVLINEVGYKTIQTKVQNPLVGLKVACYYGCQLVRPYTDFDDPDYPTSLDSLIETLGASPVDYTAKTKCCGGSLTGTIEEVGTQLNYVLLKEARRKQADVIVTICPLCQFNLEIIQSKVAKAFKEDFNLPILYFSQLMGLAFGIPREELGFNRSIIPLNNMWSRIQIGG